MLAVLAREYWRLKVTKESSCDLALFDRVATPALPAFHMLESSSKCQTRSKNPSLWYRPINTTALCYLCLALLTHRMTEKAVSAARRRIVPNGMIWVSWPKKSSGVPTELTEDVVRAVAFKHRLVDVKVCAVDETWSGLKLMIRKRDR